MLLEREEYLKSKQGEHDSGNGTYLRNFSSLRTNSLQIAIPRTRCGKFKLLHKASEPLMRGRNILRYCQNYLTFPLGRTKHSGHLFTGYAAVGVEEA